jgi:hypothetical protein
MRILLALTATMALMGCGKVTNDSEPKIADPSKIDSRLQPAGMGEGAPKQPQKDQTKAIMTP